MDTTEETRLYLRVAYGYQPMISLTRWGKVERRYCNVQEWDGSVGRLSSYIRLYGHRPPFEAVFGRKFEGVYGYRWTDKAIEVVRKVVRTDISTIEEYNQ